MRELIFIDNEGITDPHINLAIEEYALRFLDPRYTYLLFYVNERSIIIGRNQNSLEEINHEYVRERGIHVVRRLSGGGAVYHDDGNLNFSFITNHGQDRLNNFRLFTEPVARVLQSMGVNAELHGRNDIVVDGRKISGNAQYSTGKRMFSHGTLLLNSDLSEVAQALNPKPTKIQSKGHKSTRSRVANIAEYAEKEVDVNAFRRRILEGIFSAEDVPTYRLTPRDWEGVKRLMDERYGRWDWNFGAAPNFNYQQSRRYPFGEVDVRLDISRGYIREAEIFGDFLKGSSTEPITEALRNAPYDPEALTERVALLDLDPYFPGMTDREFVDLIYSGA